MFRGLPASLLLHFAVIGAGYVAWPYVSSPEISYIVVPIEIVDVAPETNIAPQVKRDDVEEEIPEEPPKLEDFLENLDALPDEEEELPEEEYAQEEEATLPPETEEAEPLPDLDEPELEEEVKPEPEEDKPEPAPAPIRVAEKDDFADFLNQTSNLLNKERTETRRAPPQATKALENERPVTETRRGAGDQTGNTSRVEGLIRSQMMLCWDDVVDLPHPERLNVTVRMALTRDGYLDGEVELVSPTRAPVGDRAMGVAIDRALRATRKCAPYRLPEGAQETYFEWKDVVLRIGPGFGG